MLSSIDIGLPNTGVTSALYQQGADSPPAFAQFIAWPPVSRPAPASAELHIGNKVFDEIAALPEDWDGYGASRIPTKTTQAARAVLEQLLNHIPLPEITPNSNATISLEWDAARGVAHLELGADDYSFFLKRESGTPVYLQGRLKDLPADWLGQLILERLFAVRYEALIVGDFRFAVDVQSQ
jgi:hypothetical protein